MMSEARSFVERVANALANLPSRFRDEYDLQANVGRALQAAGLTFEREFVVGVDRFDFVVWFGAALVIVEVKIDSPVTSVTRQLVRYASHDNVIGLVLVSSKARHHAALCDTEISGKPVRVVRPTVGAL
jgi:hypothetical protein